MQQASSSRILSSSNHSHKTTNSIQTGSLLSTHSKLVPSSSSRHKLRQADHLLAAPGVSFACSLSTYSSLHGTIRSSSIISKPSTSKSKHPPNSSQLPSSPEPPPQHVPSTPPSPPPPPPPPISSSPTQNNISSPSVSSITKLSTTSVTKPKSWADLLRRPETDGSKSNHSLSSNHLNPSHDPMTNHSIHHDRELLLSQKLNILGDQDQLFYLIPRGLVNNGNICFANAILQVLLHCSPFLNLLKHLSLILTHDFSSKAPLLDAMIAFIHEFQIIPTTELQPILDSNHKLIKYQLPNSATHLHRGDPFIAESIWRATKDKFYFEGMLHGQQEDAQEFLCFFLDSLHEELLLVTEKHDSIVRSRNGSPAEISSRSNPNPTLNSGEWLEVGSKGQAAVTRSMDTSPSPLTQLFHLKTRSVLHRSGQKDSVTFEPTNMLQLSIEHPSITTIEQALTHFSSPELISDMISKNGQRVSATKQIHIESFPPVLILHLKRFHYNSQDGTVHKSNKSIKFGTQLNIPNVMRPPIQFKSETGKDAEIKFQLFAVVYHHGPHASGGHYTVSIWQPAIDKWIYIDDTYITSTSSPNLIWNGTNGSNNHQTKKLDGKSEILSPSHQPVPPIDTSSISHPQTQSNLVGTNEFLNHGQSNLQNDIRTPYLLFYTRC